MSLLPKDEHFFELFRRQVGLSLEAADALVAASRESAPNWHDLWAKVHAIENRGDEAVHDCLVHLYQTFVTPFDPEDIHDLAACLDDTLDALDEIARVLYVIRPDGVPENFREFARVLQSEASACATAIESLTAKKEVTSQLVMINDLEEEADRLFSAAMESLFHGETDAVSLLKSKEILEVLEAAGDSFESASHVIERIALKNS